MQALANHLWQSTLFAAIAAALAFALRNNRAQTRYALWLAASLKFLIPFSLLIAAGSVVHWSTTVPFARPVQRIDQPFTSFQTNFPIEAPTGGDAFWPTVLMSLWTCGFMVVLFSWLRRWLQIRSVVRSASPLSHAAPLPILSTPSLMEPGIFGIFRPVLLLPEGITNHLTPEHLEAILAHELCHARRRDNLAAVMHMLVEAVFWFHPLVWWIGSQLIEERERACDEEVLRLGNQPHIYAESILKTCQFYLESPLPCAAGVTGADLKKRVVHIMTAPLTVRLNARKKLLLAAAAAVVIALPLATGLASQSQSAGNQPPATFEAASIRPTKPGMRGIKPGMLGIQPGGRFSTSGITMKMLMEQTYDVKDAQIAGAPSWFDNDQFDIEAKPDEATGAALDKLPPEQRAEKLKEMVRSLLADRLKLTLGHKTKEMKVLALVVAKGGPKLQKSSFNPADFKPEFRVGRGALVRRPAAAGLMRMRPGEVTSAGAQMSMLADALSGMTHQIVVDKTGLTGYYDFTLHWTPEMGEERMMAGGPGLGPEGAPPRPDSSGPSLYTAIQEQLGLKLESRKSPVDILVITHVEKPSEN